MMKKLLYDTLMYLNHMFVRLNQKFIRGLKCRQVTGNTRTYALFIPFSIFSFKALTSLTVSFEK